MNTAHHNGCYAVPPAFHHYALPDQGELYLIVPVSRAEHDPFNKYFLIS